MNNTSVKVAAQVKVQGIIWYMRATVRSDGDVFPLEYKVTLPITETTSQAVNIMTSDVPVEVGAQLFAEARRLANVAPREFFGSRLGAQ